MVTPIPTAGPLTAAMIGFDFLTRLNQSTPAGIPPEPPAVSLPGSDSEQMYHSLQHLCSLPDDTILYPGHHYSEEECATLAETKEQNVYLRVSDIDTWRQIMG